MARNRNSPEESTEQPQQEQTTQEQKDENVFKIKTHTDGDFRFGKKELAKFGFGSKAELKCTIVELGKGNKVVLKIEKV